MWAALVIPNTRIGLNYILMSICFLNTHVLQASVVGHQRFMSVSCPLISAKCLCQTYFFKGVPRSLLLTTIILGIWLGSRVSQYLRQRSFTVFFFQNQNNQHFFKVITLDTNHFWVIVWSYFFRKLHLLFEYIKVTSNSEQFNRTSLSDISGL